MHVVGEGSIEKLAACNGYDVHTPVYGDGYTRQEQKKHLSFVIYDAFYILYFSFNEKNKKAKYQGPGNPKT